MKALEIDITAQAQEDGDEQVRWILKGSENAAGRFWDAVLTTCADLAETPGIGALYECGNPRLEGMRKCGIRGFPNHLVFYRVEGDCLRILRVLHGARDLPRMFRWEVHEEAEATYGDAPDFGPPPGMFSITPQTTRAELEAELLKGLEGKGIPMDEAFMASRRSALLARIATIQGEKKTD